MNLDLTETKVVDEKSGGVKGTKLARFALVPFEFTWALAEHYGRGARKYARDLTIAEACAIIGKSCTCQNINYVKSVVSQEPGGSPKTAGVAPAMNATSENKTLSTLKDSGKIVVSGQPLTETEKKSMHGWLLGSGGLRSLVSPKKTKQESSRNKTVVQSAMEGLMVDGSILTTTIKPASSEPSFVEAVTKELGAWETIQTELKKHHDTCGSTKILFQRSINGGLQVSGDRNWEKGYKWSLSYDAAQRHLHQFAMGEWTDPETGSAHVVAAAWHCAALFIFKLRGLGTNDLYKEQ